MAGGKYTIPNHWKRSDNSNSVWSVTAPLIASPEKTTITHATNMAKERDTRSLRLKDSARINKESAVIAIPASKIWMNVSKTERKIISTYQPLKSFREE
jgi:hypothetical protein